VPGFGERMNGLVCRHGIEYDANGSF
jgi:hypothetical protein